MSIDAMVWENNRIGDNGMTTERWKEIKAIKWRPYRAPAFGRHFSSTAWAGQVVPHRQTKNERRKQRKEIGISRRAQRWAWHA